MCGRYVSASPPDVIAAYFDATIAEEALAEPAAVEPSYNVAPTNDIWAVVETPAGRRLERFRWGLIPSWAKDPRIGSKMINARAETLADKGAFKGLLASKRCIIPADGFYEWQSIAGQKTKQPQFIHRLDGAPLAFAGLWTRWRDKAGPPGAPWLYSATIITTSANATMAPVHDRMPVILSPDAWAEWLTPGPLAADEVRGLLVPAPDTLLTMHPVANDVGNVRNKGAELIEPLERAR